MKILILTNHQLGLYKFRKELLEAMMAEKYKVYVSVPKDEFTQELRNIGIVVIHNKYMERRGTNPIHDLILLNYYRWLIRKIRPDVVLTYTIKPNIYGGCLCGMMGIPYIANITGLGTSIQNGGALQVLTLLLYRIGLRKAQRIFFQNEENFKYMFRHKAVNNTKINILPGSGVNTDLHGYEPYPESDRKIVFTTIGRIMRDKGIDELLNAASEIKERHPKVVFRLIGDFDEEYENKVKRLQEKGIIEYLGFQKDIHSFVADSHAIIHASYHEGMSNVLLEAASTGRPVIATNVHGCIETFEPDITGIPFEPKNTDSLIRAVEKFLSLTQKEKVEMGRAGRKKMVQEFDRKIVIDKYMSEIKKSCTYYKI